MLLRQIEMQRSNLAFRRCFDVRLSFAAALGAELGRDDSGRLVRQHNKTFVKLVATTARARLRRRNNSFPNNTLRNSSSRMELSTQTNKQTNKTETSSIAPVPALRGPNKRPQQSETVLQQAQFLLPALARHCFRRDSPAAAQQPSQHKVFLAKSPKSTERNNHLVRKDENSVRKRGSHQHSELSKHIVAREITRVAALILAVLLQHSVHHNVPSKQNINKTSTTNKQTNSQESQTCEFSCSHHNLSSSKLQLLTALGEHVNLRRRQTHGRMNCGRHQRHVFAREITLFCCVVLRLLLQLAVPQLFLRIVLLKSTNKINDSISRRQNRTKQKQQNPNYEPFKQKKN
jgi:hypothetical protein